MSQQSSSENAQELSGNASKKNGVEAVDQGFADLKEGLLRDSSQLTGGLRDLATGVAGDAKNAVEGQLDSQKGRVVEGLGGIADALRRVSTHGDPNEGNAIAPALVPYIEEAADRVERASAYFDQKSLGEVARDVEDFARREPAFFLGGAFALGLLGGRFLKASQPANASYGSYGPQRERSRIRQSNSQRNERLVASQRPSRQHEESNGHSDHHNGAGADGTGKNMNGDRKPVGA